MEDDSCNEDDAEVPKLWLMLVMPLLLEDGRVNSEVTLAELMLDDELVLEVESGLVEDLSKEDDST